MPGLGGNGKRRWPEVLFGLIAGLAGITLLVGGWRSAAALTVLVPVGLAALGLTRLRWFTLGAAVVLVAAGGWLANRPGVSARQLSLLVGVALAAIGVGVLLVDGRRWLRFARRSDLKFGWSRGNRSDLALGLLAIAVAVLVVAWPPSIAIAAGAFLALAGLVVAAESGGLKIGAAVLVAIFLVSAFFIRSETPRPDAFYAAPTTLPAGHGVLIRSEPFTGHVPSTAHAWRILYTTTRDDGRATVASAIVLVANHVPAGPRPVLVWAHGATGIVPACAPSLTDTAVDSDSIPDLYQSLDAGWVVVAPDYPGLGTDGPDPFLIGHGAAYALLDAALAARDVSATLPVAAQTLVWGHSQGGNAALWAGILAPAYAPRVDLAGVAALAPGTGLPDLAQVWGDQPFAAYLIDAYSEIYADVRFDSYVRLTARVPARELADRCLNDQNLSEVTALLRHRSIWSRPPGTGAFGDRLRQNVPARPIVVPVLIGQGDADTTVPVRVQNAYVQQECATGTRVDYRVYPGRDHTGIFETGSKLPADLQQWSADRFGGKAAETTCGQT